MPRHAAHADVFLAISDPTRRAILDLLRSGEQTAGELFRLIAAGVQRMSQPAFSQHLTVLRRAGLVWARRQGSFQVYRLDPRPLAPVADWVSYYDKFWDEKLDGLDKYIKDKSKNADATPPGRRST